MNKKCIVMLSGGLDSRLAIKIMQEQGFEVVALFFKLPFGTGCCDEGCSFNFAQMQGVKLKVFDCTRGELLQEYLDCIKSPKYGRGAGVNPCVDCRIFIFSKAREFADSEGIDLIVSGEVLGERPMSQMMKSMNLVEEKSGLKGRLLRVLSAKHLPETDAEKKGLVNREKLYDIQGRRRVEQMKLAEKFKINYPHPAGGCMLCEKDLKNRFQKLLERGISEDEIGLVGIGRHFMIDGSWIVLGRNEKENKVIERIGTLRAYPEKSSKKIFTEGIGELIVSEKSGPSALILGKGNIKDKVLELMKAYSKQGNLEDRKNFDRWRL
ncbi:MAG: hypothetical protein ABFQ65_04005 [Nanoarchaeota archaeon]